ncbi:MAG: methionine adenosyltransferase [Clostridia bacterium]|nr:methionine adenosyltransferase [Clostridia bacterium]
MKRLFTSESVTEGHPDKICDQISDRILDEMLRIDPMSRVACETCCTTGMVMIMGEITTKANVDFQEIVRNTVVNIGYDRAKYGFDGHTCAVINSIHKQSPDIAMGVDKSYEAKEGTDTDAFDTGAGDQGLMFGYACDDTPEYMPLPISLAHKMAKQLTDVRKNGTLAYLRPDGKTQVTVEYDEAGKPVRLDAIVVSSQHDENVTLEQIREDIIREVIVPTVPASMIDGETKIYVNPTGRFVIGGPMGDSGLTGRKIIVDTYGGYSRHGGGAFSGKDPTKVDRSASYMARYLAKNVVASGAASKCEVQLAYAIGVARPVSVMVDTFGTGKIADTALADILMELVDMRPAAIIARFDLRRPIYGDTAAYGHMGREDLALPWEKLDIADDIRARL